MRTQEGNPTALEVGEAKFVLAHGHIIHCRKSSLSPTLSLTKSVQSANRDWVSQELLFRNFRPLAYVREVAAPRQVQAKPKETPAAKVPRNNSGIRKLFIGGGRNSRTSTEDTLAPESEPISVPAEVPPAPRRHSFSALQKSDIAVPERKRSRPAGSGLEKWHIARVQLKSSRDEISVTVPCYPNTNAATLKSEAVIMLQVSLVFAIAPLA